MKRKKGWIAGIVVIAVIALINTFLESYDLTGETHYPVPHQRRKRY